MTTFRYAETDHRPEYAQCWQEGVEELAARLGVEVPSDLRNPYRGR